MAPHPPLAMRPDPHPLTPDCVRGLAQFIAARKNAALIDLMKRHADAMNGRTEND